MSMKIRIDCDNYRVLLALQGTALESNICYFSIVYCLFLIK